MSKKVPVYLSKKELETLLKWNDTHEGELGNLDDDKELIERLEAELETFEG